MELLRLEEVSKSYGDKILFENINLTISTGQKIALVARNGSGKSTLLRIISGDEAPEGERAKVFVNKDVRICFLKQEAIYPAGSTIIDVIFDSDHPKLKALKKYNEALALGKDELIHKSMTEVEAIGAWEIEAKYKEILTRFNLTNFDQPTSELSGGERKRLSIAKAIIDEPSFLILDEPTNHLDIDMIEWLESYLSSNKLTVFMVTHDRYFLEVICNEIVEIDRGNIYTYRGNYSDFLEKKAIRMHNEAVHKDKMVKLFKKELAWMRRMPKARTTKAKSRIDNFDGIKSQAKVNLDVQNVEIPVQTQRLGSKILEAHAITKSFDERTIIEQFSYKFKKAEKVGIVGVNGAGKTTFLNLLTKVIRPDGGKVVIGDTVVFGHYTQEGLKLKEDKIVIDVIRDIAEYLPLEKGQKLSAESLLERFLFPRSQQRVYVSQLSGGEKRRLHLLSVLMKNPNFLILDEPTNDLDILTLNVLENYLFHFPGVVIIVSHDRYFLDKLVDHLFILDGSGNVKDYNGNYSEYRAMQKANAHQKSSDNPIEPSTKADSNEMSHEEKKKIKNRLRKLERLIEDLQKEKDKILSLFESQSVPQEEITQQSKRLNDIDEENDAAEMEWLELQEKMD